MRRYRRNADSDSRELERRAAGGDLEAADRLWIEKIRSGAIDYESAVAMIAVARGPVCGWILSWEFPGSVLVTPPKPWSDHVAIYATPWLDHDHENSSFTPVALARVDGSSQTSMRDLFTPSTGNPVADAMNYRAELAGLLASLAGAATAMLVDGLFMPRNHAAEIINDGIAGPQ